MRILLYGAALAGASLAFAEEAKAKGHRVTFRTARYPLNTPSDCEPADVVLVEADQPATCSVADMYARRQVSVHTIPAGADLETIIALVTGAPAPVDPSVSADLEQRQKDLAKFTKDGLLEIAALHGITDTDLTKAELTKLILAAEFPAPSVEA